MTIKIYEWSTFKGNSSTIVQIKSEAQLMKYVWKLIDDKCTVFYNSANWEIKSTWYPHQECRVKYTISPDTYNEHLYLKYIYYKYLFSAPKCIDIDYSRLFVNLPQETEDDMSF